MSMNEVIDEITDRISANVPKAENEYMGEDGLLHCSVCHRATQTKIIHPFLNQEKIVRCICDCRKKERDAHKEREKQEERERQRRVCFAGNANDSKETANMNTWTFANDDRASPKLSDAMQNYVNNFPKFRAEGKGLLLYGNVGTGKTYLSACVANALIDKDYHVIMFNFEMLERKLRGMFKEAQEYIDSLNKYSLLILDDLGAERKSDYMTSQVYSIIDARYRSGLPFIITTNLSWKDITQPEDMEHARIYDRILERCHPIEVPGVSRRRKKLSKDYAETKALLGL